MPRISAREIAADLVKKIKSGVWPRGAMLPSEPELAAEYGTTRSTINRAMAGLRRAGLVSPRQGRGTTVTFMPPITRDATARYNSEQRNQGAGAFAAEITRLGMVPRSEPTVRREVPPAHIAEMLGVPEGQEVLVRHRIMYADDQAVQIAPTYIPLDIAEGTQLEELEQPPGGMVTTMKQIGHREVEIEEILTPAREPNDAEADILGLGQDQSVFELHHLAFDASGRTVEVTVHVGPTHFWQFKSRFKID